MIVEPNLPAVEQVTHIHEWIEQCSTQASAVFTARYVTTTERRKEGPHRLGTRPETYRAESSTPGLLDLRRQRRHHFEQVADNAVIGHFEDRGLRVLVDRDDRLRALHPHQVLNRARDANGHVNLRR